MIDHSVQERRELEFDPVTSISCRDQALMHLSNLALRSYALRVKVSTVLAVYRSLLRLWLFGRIDLSRNFHMRAPNPRQERWMCRLRFRGDRDFCIRCLADSVFRTRPSAGHKTYPVQCYISYSLAAIRQPRVQRSTPISRGRVAWVLVQCLSAVLPTLHDAPLPMSDVLKYKV